MPRATSSRFPAQQTDSKRGCTLRGSTKGNKLCFAAVSFERDVPPVVLDERLQESSVIIMDLPDISMYASIARQSYQQ